MPGAPKRDKRWFAVLSTSVVILIAAFVVLVSVAFAVFTLRLIREASVSD
jgi:hypothetical protein